jgi:hypothetical protein
MQASKIIGITIGAIALLLSSGSEGKSKLPRPVIGKVFFTKQRIRDQAPMAMARKFSAHKPKIELKRGADKHWNVTLVAFFRKESYPGPITIWLYDKKDKAAIRDKEPVNAVSVDAKPKTTFIYDLDINPDLGFNKGYTYLIHVGQIIGRKTKVYARGEVSLLP